MAVTESRSPVTVDHNNPLHLHLSDTLSGDPLIPIQLVGTENYARWSRSMKIALLEKNKLGFVDGTCVRADYEGDMARQWDRCDAIVLTWMMNVVSNELLSGIVYADSARGAWVMLEERFGVVDGLSMFRLYKAINMLRQGSSRVSVYFSKLNDLWDELDALVPPPCCECEKSKASINQQRLIQFLIGLNDSCGRVRSRILIMEPLPSVNQAYALVMRQKSVEILEKSFMQCEFCHKRGHLKENCYRIIGFPGDIKKSPHTANNYDTKMQPPPAFTQKQLEEIMKMISKWKSVETTTNTAAAAGSLQWQGPRDW